MNVRRSILKISVFSLFLLCNGALFGMRCNYKGVLTISKPDMIKKLAPETKEYLIDYLNDPITFGQTNKENHTLVKYQGLRNVFLAQKNDPDFVFSHYVPILLIDGTPKRDNYSFRCINSYKLVKMSNNFCYRESDIISLRNKRLDQALKQKKKLYGDDKVKFDCDSLSSDVGPLTMAALFGSDQKILHEINILRNAMCGRGGAVFKAIQCLIAYPAVHDNNALEILVSVEKEMRSPILTPDLFAFHYYLLLFLADKAKNKKAFKVLIDKDPFDAINIIWVDTYAKNRIKDMVIKPYIPLTILDRMIEEGGFDSGNVALFIDNGGKTAQQLLELK